MVEEDAEYVWCEIFFPAHSNVRVTDVASLFIDILKITSIEVLQRTVCGNNMSEVINKEYLTTA